MSNFPAIAFVVIFLTIYVDSCNLSTPIIVKAYDDGWVNFTIPAQSAKKFGIEYRVHRDGVQLFGGIKEIGLLYSSEQKFSERRVNGPSPLGHTVDYEMYEGSRATRKCYVVGEPIVITELLPAV